MTAEAVKSSALKPNSKTIGRDLLAGLIAAIAAIPDGMASAVLAGVNPVLGLYNLMVGTPVAALFSSSVYMAVINTSAMAPWSLTVLWPAIRMLTSRRAPWLC